MVLPCPPYVGPDCSRPKSLLPDFQCISTGDEVEVTMGAITVTLDPTSTVTVVTDPNNPINIDWENMPVGIENTSNAVACAVDADGKIIGRIYWESVRIDEATGLVEYDYIFADGVNDPVIYDPAVHGTLDFECDGEKACDPKFTSYTGATLPVTPATLPFAFDSFSIINTSNADVTVTSSALSGSAVIPPMGSLTPPQFNCPVGDLQVSGECLEKVYIYLHKRG